MGMFDTIYIKSTKVKEYTKRLVGVEVADFQTKSLDNNLINYEINDNLELVAISSDMHDENGRIEPYGEIHDNVTSSNFAGEVQANVYDIQGNLLFYFSQSKLVAIGNLLSFGVYPAEQRHPDTPLDRIFIFENNEVQEVTVYHDERDHPITHILYNKLCGFDDENTSQCMEVYCGARGIGNNNGRTYANQWCEPEPSKPTKLKPEDLEKYNRENVEFEKKLHKVFIEELRHPS